ncbi:MAG TPA: glucans biosynthesis glucosyltransferase MdoH [Ideonella sp.]|uniref:glucans biosynthesis glucosyltransferase MdoH n=1 Tax=Ideonella sp. TaxID=1929293 RepID=UPI002BAE3E16|nr:glucans biosynthesis glucosyltransferase MdoH [Ideonella sp.]HSI47819.1 glucans biosynthesis glucosyltransferase MdoH [Ideonella sp.]
MDASPDSAMKRARGNTASYARPVVASATNGSSSNVPGMPAIHRGSMVPTRWLGVAARLRGEQAAADAPWRDSVAKLEAQPKAAWEAAAAKRRNWLMFWTLGASMIAAGLMWSSQPGAGSDVLEAAQLALFTLLFAWVSAGAVTAVMGFIVTLKGDPHALSAKSVEGLTLPADARTAVIMPICNEDVATVFAGLRATCESLSATGAQRAFDMFVLSDTSDPTLRAAELRAWHALRQQLTDAGSELRVYYRWRQRRTKRKAGNVADFCRRWGKDYRYMVVMDADSVMSGDTLVTLARLMEANPRAGILQTAPRAAGHATLHARAQQFASRVTGRLFTAGMQFWQLGEAHYWGHNAIIRVEPFMQHCGLATLPGTGALAGEILSHDFVEAALMRRAGYEVWLVNDLEGSYEQQPPHLLAELQRDRRWCQGNLQNARLIAEPGLKSVHRAMLGTGAMAYLSAPLWLAYVVLGVTLWLTGAGDNTPTLLAGRSVATLWASTALMLAMPRVLGVLAVILRGEQAEFGGSLKLIGSSALEAGMSMLQAPLRMAAHSLFVIGGLTGWKLEWTSPPREASDLSWGDATRRFGPLSAVVGLLLAAIYAASPVAALWLLPMGLPLLLAIPFTVMSAHGALGQRLRNANWLLIPEEARSPAVLRQAWHYAHHYAAQPVLKGAALLADLPRLASLALQAVGPRRTGRGLRGEQRRQRVLQLSRSNQPAAKSEQLRFLNEPHSLRLLHAAMAGNVMPH